MLGSYTTIEILLAAAVFLLAAHEFKALGRARREGKTENVSRLFTSGMVMAAVVIYAIVAWLSLPLEGEGPITDLGAPMTPWAFLILGGIMAVIAAYEAVALLRARRLGLTSNVSRLVSYAAMFLVVLAMLGLTDRKWNDYLDRLETTALEGEVTR